MVRAIYLGAAVILCIALTITAQPSVNADEKDHDFEYVGEVEDPTPEELEELSQTGKKNRSWGNI